MGTEIKVTSKGQLTLPKSLRERLDIRQGDTLYVESIGNNRFVLATRKRAPKALPEDNIVLKTAGVWKDRNITPDYVDELRRASNRRLEDL